MLDLLAGLLFLMSCVFLLCLILKGWFSGRTFTGDKEFKASLAKNLPPDVQADMKPRQLGVLTIVAITILAVVGWIFAASILPTWKAFPVIYVGGLVGAVVSVAVAALIARTWLVRRNPGGVLADLSPYPLAGAESRVFVCDHALSSSVPVPGSRFGASLQTPPHRDRRSHVHGEGSAGDLRSAHGRGQETRAQQRVCFTRSTKG